MSDPIEDIDPAIEAAKIVESAEVLEKKFKNTKKASKLKRVFEEQGPLSEEFYLLVHDFGIFIFMRTIGRFDEDMLHDAYLKVVRALDYFDPKRTNIVTFIFSTIRNEASRNVHHIKKRNAEVDESELYELGKPCAHQAHLESISRMMKTFDKFKYIIYSQAAKEEIITSVMSGEPTIGGKRVLWEQTRAAICESD